MMYVEPVCLPSAACVCPCPLRCPACSCCPSSTTPRRDLTGTAPYATLFPCQPPRQLAAHRGHDGSLLRLGGSRQTQAAAVVTVLGAAPRRFVIPLHALEQLLDLLPASTSLWLYVLVHQSKMPLGEQHRA
eukprot:CAMPEP_0196779726 /NCGR_PEP_ID=MMETSP1104-20130614/6555_1 /TAXON_ID=33652 /ORGANISM="Cafeteria sp., Strain Caron Lab Isolate" /LENGTH=130 /DNA_ID=CAMNT_0042149909 /DNA_START=105 /DNA_END=497 /DNA_ORIENTATION=+